ncbi:MAG TPA: hypothetical protein VFP18_13590 [Candidatus Binatia bacterium]|nr:hypothetical protein [Candidatus Binatia bacterium]
MTKDEIIAAVGYDAFKREAKRIRADAARPDYGRGGDVSSELPHELASLIWDSDLPAAEKIQLFFEIYDEVPSYGLSMYSTHFYKEFSVGEKALWWAGVRERLGRSDAALRNPLEYSLWCDYFENTETVEEAWQALTSDASNERILRCVIKASGPVPYELKRALYEQLAERLEWQQPIFEALFYSAHDYFGQIDPTHARHLLARLQIAEGTPGLIELESKLTAA